jgi:hypothetical protein
MNSNSELPTLIMGRKKQEDVMLRKFLITIFAALAIATSAIAQQTPSGCNLPNYGINLEPYRAAARNAGQNPDKVIESVLEMAKNYCQHPNSFSARLSIIQALTAGEIDEATAKAALDALNKK